MYILSIILAVSTMFETAEAMQNTLQNTKDTQTTCDVSSGSVTIVQKLQTILSIPESVFGLQNDQSMQKVCEKDEACYHIALEDQDIYADNQSDDEKIMHHIFFPKNGKQPTTREAAEYAAANVNSNQITDWYIRAFGGDHAVQLSLYQSPAKEDSAPKWITTDQQFRRDGKHNLSECVVHNIEPKHVIDVSNEDIEFQYCFWENFRKIASDPVGRTLLYRLLIELGRVCTADFEFCVNIDSTLQKIKINKGSSVSSNLLYDISRGKKVAIDAFLENIIRDQNRAISIKESDQSSQVWNIINLKKSYIRVFCLKIDDKNQLKIAQENEIKDITLFHEILHWFHSLVDFKANNGIPNQEKQLPIIYYGVDDNDIKVVSNGDALMELKKLLTNEESYLGFLAENELSGKVPYDVDSMTRFIQSISDDEFSALWIDPKFLDGNGQVINIPDLYRDVSIEMRATLGTPNPQNTAIRNLISKKLDPCELYYRNGLDLSTNAYTLSKYYYYLGWNGLGLTVSHNDPVLRKPIPIAEQNGIIFKAQDNSGFNPYRFSLMLMVAKNCVEEVYNEKIPDSVLLNMLKIKKKTTTTEQ